MSIFTLWQTLPVGGTTSYLLAEVTNDETYTKAVVASLMVTAGMIFLLSVLLGELCVRLSLPTVLGDLATGIILGSSILGILVFPEIGEPANSTMLQFLLG